MPSFEIEQAHWQAGRRFVAGVDEAGRGCLAGPVVAAAVILPPEADLPDLNDSKRLTPTKREALFPLIICEALAVGVGQCGPDEVDALNVLHASLEAMRRAVDELFLRPDILLIDGDRALPVAPCPQQTLVRGDGRSLSIAAASVVAKVVRDRLMVGLDAEHPVYGWAIHKGYPTAAHYEALREHGPSPHHRRSFRLG
ncbi:MAG TPA: ribonuclease HII [Rubricoccaceae bacterium]|nr:ribonuclease HII [Rubricoccaceae bacterium]